MTGAAPAATSTELAFVVALAIGATALALGLAHPQVIGHDDGIYAAVSASLVRTGEYRLISLPTQPPQTKYPPLYPALLAPVWLVVPAAPANLLALKTVNALILGGIAVLFWRLVRRVPGLTASDRVLAVTILISAPGVFSFTDLLVSELAFVFLLLAVMLSLPTDARHASAGRLAAGGMLVGALVLTRTVGIAAAPAVIWQLTRTARSRRALVAVGAGLAVVAPWLLWRGFMFDGNAGPLERYYLSYEPSAWEWLVSDPSFAYRVLTTNVAFYVQAVPLAFGLYVWPVGVMAALVTAAGVRNLRPPERSLVPVLLVCYSLAVVGHPLPMERYLVPLIPIVAVLFMGGVGVLRMRLAGRAPGAELLASIPLIVLLSGNAAWLHHCAETKSEGPQWHFGQRAAFEWSGFEEVFAWIRLNTPQDAVLATAFDPVYFLHTGRRAIRPWIHEPERYRATYGWTARPAPVATIAQELDRLGVSVLVVDPMGVGGEAAHARETIDRLVGGTPRRWIPAYETANRQHRVYRRSAAGVPPP